MHYFRFYMGVLGLIAISLVFPGCGKAKIDEEKSGLVSDGNEDRSPRFDGKLPAGPVTDQLKELLSIDSKDPCDLDQETRRMQAELVQAVDKRGQEILELAGKVTSSDRWKREKLGPINVEVPVRKSENHVGWKESRDSWKKIYADFQNIKDSTTDARWLYLNGDVRSILWDDGQRVSGRPYHLDKDSKSKIEDAMSTIQKCKNDSACKSFDFTAEALAFLKSANKYNSLLESKEINTSGTAMLEMLREDHIRYEMRVNPFVKRTAEKELKIQMDPGPFSEVKEQLAGYIESVWKSDSLSVKVDWLLSASSTPGLYKFFVEDETGGRSWSNWIKREIHLYQDVDTPAIAHEVGHALGFLDHYYTTWKAESCEYLNQVNDQDIMSGHTTGSVTEEEWKELAETYKANPT